MLLYKQKKNQGPKGNRLLISVTVLGSAGPIRFVVNEEELVAAVIDTALKSYAREGRLPVLGSNLNDFFLYCPTAGTDALIPWETIGSQGARNFMLCKKPRSEKVEDDGKSNDATARKASGNWKRVTRHHHIFQTKLIAMLGTSIRVTRRILGRCTCLIGVHCVYQN